MATESIEQLKRRLKAEKEKLERIEKNEQERQERNVLTSELRKTKFAQIKKGRLGSTLSNLGKGFGNIAKNLEANQVKSELNIMVGSKVLITNGMYDGKTMSINSFIDGGIEGRIDGNVVRIRHGSYRKA